MGDHVADGSVEAWLKVCFCCWGLEGSRLQGVLGRPGDRKEGEGQRPSTAPFIRLRPWQERVSSIFAYPSPGVWVPGTHKESPEGKHLEMIEAGW